MLFNSPEFLVFLPIVFGLYWFVTHRQLGALYFDDHHLRGVGAELYSEWLAEQVQAILTEPDRTSGVVERDGGGR